MLGNLEICEFFVLLVGVFDYWLGKVYVLYVDYFKGLFVIVGSVGYKEGGLIGYEVDVIFFGIGGFGG